MKALGNHNSVKTQKALGKIKFTVDVNYRKDKGNQIRITEFRGGVGLGNNPLRVPLEMRTRRCGGFRWPA